MGQALLLAREAYAQREVPVGAVVVYNDEIVGRGYNRPIGESDATAHAEILALQEAGQALGNYRLLDTTLYVTLEPCCMCVGAMIHARIGHLVFGAYDEKTGAVCSRFALLQDPAHNHKVEYTGGVMQPECSEILSSFFRELRENS